MRLLLLLIALIALISTNQQKVKIGPGFFTGGDYFKMSDTERRAYATGAINGMLVAPFFGAPEDNLNWLKTCTTKLSDEQLAGMISQHLRDQPDQLQSNLNVVTFNAIRDACRKM